MRFQQLASLALSGLALAQDSDMSLVDVLGSQNDSLSMLGTILATQPSLVRALSTMSNVTILAPDNDALKAFVDSSGGNDTLMSDPGLVTAILSYHVLNGTYYASNFTEDAMFVETMLNNETYANVTGGQVVEAMMMDDTVSFYSALKTEANVTKGDLNFTGGVVHIINDVLRIPMNLSDTAINANLTSAAGALIEADVVSKASELEDVTIFVPDNDAFAAIGSITGDLSSDDLEKILEYHVVPGMVGYSNMLSNMSLQTAEGSNVTITVDNGTVFVNSAKVVLADVLVANGVVHVIDSVLNPNNTEAAADPSATGSPTPAFEGASSATDGAIPFTSGVPSATVTATGIEEAMQSTASEDGVPQATAAIAMGALLGGAAIIMNGI